MPDTCARLHDKFQTGPCPPNRRDGPAKSVNMCLELGGPRKDQCFDESVLLKSKRITAVSRGYDEHQLGAVENRAGGKCCECPGPRCLEVNRTSKIRFGSK